jgi:hypothetical protein
LENGTLDVQEEDGYNNPFSLRTSHDSITESADKEEGCGEKNLINPLVSPLIALTILI